MPQKLKTIIYIKEVELTSPLSFSRDFESYALEEKIKEIFERYKKEKIINTLKWYKCGAKGYFAKDCKTSTYFHNLKIRKKSERDIRTI